LLWVFGQNKFKNVAPQLAELRRIGSYDHVFGYWSSAGSRKSPQILNLHDAQSASSVRSEIGMVTQGWNINTRLASCLKYRGTFLRLDRLPVYSQIYDLCFFTYNHI
jgi:hypothetical protein